MNKSITLVDDPAQRLVEITRLKDRAEREKRIADLGDEAAKVELEIRRAEVAELDRWLIDQREQEWKATMKRSGAIRAAIAEMDEAIKIGQEVERERERRLDHERVVRETAAIEPLWQRAQQERQEKWRQAAVLAAIENGHIAPRLRRNGK